MFAFLLNFILARRLLHIVGPRKEMVLWPRQLCRRGRSSLSVAIRTACIVSGVRWVKNSKMYCGDILLKNLIKNVYTYTLFNSFLGGFKYVDSVDCFNYGIGCIILFAFFKVKARFLIKARKTISIQFK